MRMHFPKSVSGSTRKLVAHRYYKTQLKVASRYKRAQKADSFKADTSEY